MFSKFQTAIATQFAAMCAYPLFRVDATKEELWGTYLSSFPKGSNPVYRKRTEHDCSCCKQFIRAVGNVVAITPEGQVLSIWDTTIENEPAYQQVATHMALLIRSKPITDTFLHDAPTAGTAKSFEDTVDGVQTWHHFFVNVPKQYVAKRADIPTKLNDTRTKHAVLKRGLEELTEDALTTVLELIAQNSLYRGEEHKYAVTSFLTEKRKYLNTPLSRRETLPWAWSVTLGDSVARFRNTAIGQLVIALSDGKELEEAVKAFEAMVAPTNYKRPTALVTKAMIEAAKVKVEELGLTSALERRYATINDITINNVLFADRSAKKAMGVFDTLTASAPVSTKSFDKVEEVAIDKFLTDILPKATGLELMVENGHMGNFMSLIAPVDPTALGMFKWGNNFSWSYTGDVADSLRQRVAAAGGRVDGVLRFSHSWNHVGRNASLMDLHVFMPGAKHADGCHDRYPATPRVGWNKRDDHASGGVQDVDYTAAAPEDYVPVENITFPDLKRLKEGTYTFKIHNWQLRQPTTSGFKAEIEFEGQVFEYDYPKPLKHKEWLTVATAVLKNGRFSITHALPHGASIRQAWGISTMSFQKVSAVMLSPNYWDGHGVGNKHYFFMLEACRNEGVARGFYNEFLKSDLDAHRKVIEMVGAKMKTDHSEQQLSGLGFSSTQRNSVLCRVSGSFSRVIKLVF